MRHSPVIVLLVSLSMLAMPLANYAQTPPPPPGAPPGAPPADSAPAAPVYTQEQLDQLLAPVALYPDALLAQVLMAATYPLEVVEAARWVKANPNVQGDELTSAMGQQPWDESVKSLVPFPQVLAMMNDKLDWTQKVGDAFLAQQAQVMDTVQGLRAKAQAAGNLNSNQQQNVVMQEKTIIIEPAQPQYVYVPVYNPTIVYGGWWWPSYPPYYFPPPPGAAFVSGFFWGAGIAAGAALWGGWNWNNHSVNININNYNRYNRTNITNNNWQHNVNHRGSVPYRDQASRDRYQNQKTDRQAVDARRDYRGQTGGNQAGNRPGQGNAGDRPGAGGGNFNDTRPGDRSPGGVSAPRPADRNNGASSRPSTSQFDHRSTGAFDVGSSNSARNDATRGQASRQQMNTNRGSSAGAANRGGGGARPSGGGGGARGGGGGGGGRGGGGRGR